MLAFVPVLHDHVFLAHLQHRFLGCPDQTLILLEQQALRRKDFS